MYEYEDGPVFIPDKLCIDEYCNEMFFKWHLLFKRNSINYLDDILYLRHQNIDDSFYQKIIYPQ